MSKSKPYARLFIMGGIGLSQQEWRDKFGQYGTIKEVYIITDKRTGDEKGFVYITFSKPSEAFLAKESLNGQKICDLSKAIKVVTASDSKDGNRREEEDDEKFKKICVRVSTDWTEEKITDEFSNFGEIFRVNICKSKKEGATHTLAFIRYDRAYCAAVTLEEADECYDAQYCKNTSRNDRKRPLEDRRDSYDRDPYDRDPYDRYPPRGYDRDGEKRPLEDRRNSYDRDPYDRDPQRGYDRDGEHPAAPNSNKRLFILGGKGLSEEDWRNTFGEYGTIENVVILKDKRTGEQKGMCYIAFSKASEALLAKEKLNGERICGIHKTILVVTASDKTEGNQKEDDERDEKYTCICIKVKVDMTKEDILDEFSQFGKIDRANIAKPRPSYNNTLAFIHFDRPYCAALALEGCKESLKAEWFQPKKSRKDTARENLREYEYERREFLSQQDFEPRRNLLPDPHDLRPEPRDLRPDPRDLRPDPRDVLRGANHIMSRYDFGNEDTCLEIMTPSGLPYQLLHRLFDLIPGMESYDFDEGSSIARVRYATPTLAAYAKDKFSGFEYPPGQPLGVRFASDNTNRHSKVVEAIETLQAMGARGIGSHGLESGGMAARGREPRGREPRGMEPLRSNRQPSMTRQYGDDGPRDRKQPKFMY